MSNIMSSIMSTPTSTMTINSNRRKYTLKSFQYCYGLRRRLMKVAVKYIGHSIVKALRIREGNEFVRDYDKLEIPLGLFGLDLDNFFHRCESDDIFIDLLFLAKQKVIEKARISILLKNFISLVIKLFALDYQPKSVFAYLSGAEELITIHEKIIEAYKNNVKTVKQLGEELEGFPAREMSMLAAMDMAVCNAKNKVAETILIVGSIENRYQLNFVNTSLSQVEYRGTLEEKRLGDELENLQIKTSETNLASAYLCEDLKLYAKELRAKFEDMLVTYDTDMEKYNGKITYKLNEMKIMRERREECIQKLLMFEEEGPKIEQWAAGWSEIVEEHMLQEKLKAERQYKKYIKGKTQKKKSKQRKKQIKELK